MKAHKTISKTSRTFIKVSTWHIVFSLSFKMYVYMYLHEQTTRRVRKTTEYTHTCRKCIESTQIIDKLLGQGRWTLRDSTTEYPCAGGKWVDEINNSVAYTEHDLESQNTLRIAVEPFFSFPFPSYYISYLVLVNKDTPYIRLLIFFYILFILLITPFSSFSISL